MPMLYPFGYGVCVYITYGVGSVLLVLLITGLPEPEVAGRENSSLRFFYAAKIQQPTKNEPWQTTIFPNLLPPLL